MLCPGCDHPYAEDQASICQDCHTVVCERCVDRDGLCVECADGESAAERRRERGATSFAESHEAAWREKRAVR